MGAGCEPIGAFRKVTGRGLGVEKKRPFSGLTRGRHVLVRARFMLP
jgi:hypothetical protein